MAIKTKTIIIISSLLFVFGVSGDALAAIQFSENGKWETTFDCSESTQFDGGLCDGMDWDGNWYFDEHRTQITSGANNSEGDGGLGARFWVGDGQNKGTGTIIIGFPSPQQELWIRYYVRYEQGFSWGFFGYDKQLYINATNTGAITGFHNDPRNQVAIVAQGTSNYYQVISTDYGWDDIMGGQTGDGQWHCYEIYLKMDTNGSNGIGRIWVDGVLRASNTSVDWSNNDESSKAGWNYFHFHSNQNSPVYGPYSVDYDDMVIYNTTPPNRDTEGNPFIGPIQSNEPEPNEGIIFQDDYDSPGDTGWTCSDVLRDGYTSRAACPLPDTYGGITKYAGEISPGGRSGNSFKLWRRNGLWTGYSGYLNKSFTAQEFANQYKELFIRWYVKVPPEWDAQLADGGNTHKLNRIWTGTEPGAQTQTWFLDVKGGNFKNGRFSFYYVPEGNVYYADDTISELGINDGQWHSLEWYLKLNSTTGSTDGGFTFYVDGVEQATYRPYGPPATYGQWGLDIGATTNEFFTATLPPAIGNLTDGYWIFPTDGWYAIEFDDYAVSTSYIGPIEDAPDPIPGDINGDGVVNIFDYNIFLQHFGVVEDCQNSADLNGDCR
jgi:hypothetical protein